MQLAAAVLAVCAARAQATQDARPPAAPSVTAITLRVGDPAPRLDIAKWIKGDEVAEFQRGRVYIVEFWATWCGPCVQSMPHLSAAQREYSNQGLTVIGITSADKHGNTLEAAERMIAAKGELADYAIAFDNERITNNLWMRAAGATTIPQAFVVDREGRIAFIDNPAFLDDPLEQIVSDTWDIEKGTAALKEAHDALTATMAKVQESDAAGLAAFAEFEAGHPRLARQLDSTRIDLALRAGDASTVQMIAARWMETAIAHRNYDDLVVLARKIVDPVAKIEHRDLDLALRIANRARELTADKHAGVFDVLALIHSWKGDLAQAIELQTRAVALVQSLQKPLFEMRLAEYKLKAGVK